MASTSDSLRTEAGSDQAAPSEQAPPSPNDPGEVEAVLDAAITQARTQHQAYIQAVQGGVLHPLHDLIDTITPAHAAARAALDDALAGKDAAQADATGIERRAVWTMVRRYRRTVVESVWGPVEATLQAMDMGAAMQAHRAELREARAALAAGVPSILRRPEPATLYAARADDGTGVRVRKAAVRAYRTLTGIGRPGRTYVQEVPMAALIEDHATRRLPDVQESIYNAVEQRIARWVARLEHIASEWTHVLLEVEHLLDAPSFHYDAVLGEGKEAAPSGPALPADPASLLEQVRKEADALDALMAEGRALHVDDHAVDLDAAAATAADALRAEVEQAGSFLANVHPALPERHTQRRLADRRQHAEAWEAWHRQVVQRLHAVQALHAMRDTTENELEQGMTQVLGAGYAPVRDICMTAADELSTIRDEVQALLHAPDAPKASGGTSADESTVRLGDERALLVALDRLYDRAMDVVEQTLVGPLRQRAFRREMHEAIDERRTAIEAEAAAQPDVFVVHPLIDADASGVDPSGDAHDIEWRATLLDAFDVLLFDAWRVAVAPLAEAIDAAKREAEEIQAIVQFNMGAALEELQDVISARRRGKAARKTESGASVEGARELAYEGLQRCIDGLTEQVDTLDRAPDAFVADAWQASRQAWTRLHGRTRAAGQAQEHVLRLHALLMRVTRRAGAMTQKEVRRAALQVQRALLAGRRRAEALVRMGRKVVGDDGPDATALLETIESLATVNAELDELPLVYRRLFSFRPVMDPGLLIAREEDLGVLRWHIEQWKRGFTSALILTGPQGSGRTSVLNVLRKTTLRRARHHHIDLNERLASEAEFATKIAQALGLRIDEWRTSSSEDPERTPPVRSLDDVARHLLGEPNSERLWVCTIEHLEHAFARTIDGTRLIGRVLAFLSETDTRIQWIGTMSSSAWQIICTYEPAATGLVVRHELSSVSRTQLEELILQRHRRSGLPLVFEMPDEAVSSLLARRVRATSDEARRQELLQSDFFDRLYTVCGQNIMLALFYWFRAAYLAPDNDHVRVRPLDPISFAYLDAFSLPQAFALKALLEHTTLTVDELANILQISPDVSSDLLESLGNALLIAPADALDPPGTFQFTAIDPHVRYRIRPFIVHPVTRFLRSRNIVH